MKILIYNFTKWFGFFMMCFGALCEFFSVQIMDIGLSLIGAFIAIAGFITFELSREKLLK